MKKFSHIGFRNGPIDTTLLGATSDIAFSAAIRAVSKGLMTSENGLVITAQSAADLALLAAPLIAFAAAEQLRLAGKHAQVITGAAIWSVGPGDMHTLDHRIQHRQPVPAAVKHADFHTWIVYDGWLYDFAARTLEARFNQAAFTLPFSTPSKHWRQFPDVIRHDLSRPMPDPLRDINDAYAYADRGPIMLDEFYRQHGTLIQSAKSWALKLAA